MTVFRIAFLAVCLVTGHVSAQSVSSDHVTAEWVAESDHIQPGTDFWLGLKLTHADHWHTYWTNPGDSGLATTVEWDLPEGFSAGELQWPYPQWLLTQGQVSFGYDGTAMALVRISAPADLKAGTTVKLGGEVSWLECEDVCIPGGGDAFLSLPVKDEPAAASAALAVARENLPLAGEDWSGTTVAAPTKATIRVRPPADIPADVGTVRFFPDEEYVFDYADGLPVRREEGAFVVEAKLVPGGEGLTGPVSGVWVAEKGWNADGSRKAVHVVAPVGSGKAAAVPAAGGEAKSLPMVLLLAFLGGIILNAMPCVFPVISLKILGFVNLAGSDPSKVWRHGLVFAAGVMISFWVLAGALLAIKATTPNIGWGYQLSQPGFVVGITMLFYLLSLNLFGVFEFGTSLMGVGANASAKEGFGGTFFSGVLATIVATPCTGPFMGAAVGLAFTQPPVVGMTIFTALGAGMATPYLLLSRFPKWLERLPRPGPWMESLKQFMGFLLMAFVLYLVWLFTDLRGHEGLANILAGLLIVGIGAWVYGRWGGLGRERPMRIGAAAVGLGLLVAGCAYALTPPRPNPWLDYSPELVAELKASGEPFFVDFTASWCVTCQANKKAVLNTEEIQKEFKAHKVTLVKADWTRQQEPITSALAEFGRQGVPLYLLYGDDPNQSPNVLPELLTKSIVLNALKEL